MQEQKNFSPLGREESKGSAQKIAKAILTGLSQSQVEKQVEQNIQNSLEHMKETRKGSRRYKDFVIQNEIFRTNIKTSNCKTALKIQLRNMN